VSPNDLRSLPRLRSDILGAAGDYLPARVSRYGRTRHPRKSRGGALIRVVLGLVGLSAAGLFLWWILADHSSDRTATSDVNTEISKAQRLAQSGKLSESLALLEKAKHVDPKSPAPYIFRAQLLAQSFHMREALTEVERAQKIAPTDPDVALSVAKYTPPYLPSAQVEQAAKRAVELAPQNPEAHYYLGLAIAGSSDTARFPEAMREFEQANTLAPPQPKTLVELGKISLTSGDTTRGVAYLETALQLIDQERSRGQIPRIVDIQERKTVLFWLSQAYRRAGRTKDAQRASAASARASAEVHDFETLQSRAMATPPDLAAQKQLERYFSEGGAARLETSPNGS
jgi:tetratricopeptide (TPR) repeat protein